MHSKAMSPGFVLVVGRGLSVRSSAEGCVPLYNDHRPAVRSRLLSQECCDPFQEGRPDSWVAASDLDGGRQECDLRSAMRRNLWFPLDHN